MTRNRSRYRRLLCGGLLTAGLLTAGCTQPLHLQYDYSRAYTDAMTIQADLSRASVSESGYVLSGVEALELRQRALEEATDTESGTAEVATSFVVE